jgi:SPP1 gp7 family putative phage head morphogenesis protein
VRAAAPPAPTRNAISAWASVYGRLGKEVDKWAARLAAGQPPLSAGEQARLRSLITAVQQLQPIGSGEAQVAAAIMDGALEASRASLDASVTRLPNHVVASAVSAADEFGWKSTLNKPGVAAIVNGGVGQMTSDWARLNGELQDRIRLELAQGVSLGENPKKVAKRLHKTLDGAMSMGQARSVVISRTVMAAAYDQATLDVYRQAAQEGLVAGWEWVTAEDDRVCVVCSELNGTLHAVNEPTYKHPSCRCTMIAVDPETAAKRSFNEGYDNLELHTGESGWTSWRKKKDKR